MLISLLLTVFTSFYSWADPTHHCRVAGAIQHYNGVSMQFIWAEDISSDWHDVTLEPHEDGRIFALKSTAGRVVGETKLWTGTLFATPDGDVLQAHATFKVEGISGMADLLLATDARLGKASTVLDSSSQAEFLLMPIDLVCMRK